MPLAPEGPTDGGFLVGERGPGSLATCKLRLALGERARVFCNGWIYTLHVSCFTAAAAQCVGAGHVRYVIKYIRNTKKSNKNKLKTCNLQTRLNYEFETCGAAAGRGGGSRTDIGMFSAGNGSAGRGASDCGGRGAAVPAGGVMTVVV